MVLPELRARMVEALLDAARERRQADLPAASRPEHTRLAHIAAHHALELADQHLFLTGEVPTVLPPAFPPPAGENDADSIRSTGLEVKDG